MSAFLRARFWVLSPSSTLLLSCCPAVSSTPVAPSLGYNVMTPKSVSPGISPPPDPLPLLLSPLLQPPPLSLTWTHGLTCLLESSTGMPYNHLKLLRYKWNSFFSPNMLLLPRFPSQGLTTPSMQSFKTSTLLSVTTHTVNPIYLLNVSNPYISRHPHQQFLILATAFSHGDYSNQAPN